VVRSEMPKHGSRLLLFKKNAKEQNTKKKEAETKERKKIKGREKGRFRGATHLLGNNALGELP